MRAAGLSAKSNIKFVFEGEEEAGSPNLETDPGGEQGAVRRRRLADVRRAAASDPPPVDRLRRARRDCSVDITVYGPRTELHSGHYGNWAPNPALSLARLLASMKDDNGRVLVDSFYDGVEPLSDTGAARPRGSAATSTPS